MRESKIFNFDMLLVEEEKS